ncbi:MAG: glycoside hydrolase family 9 protein [Bacteroidales bacterium]
MEINRLIKWPILLVVPLLFTGCGNGEGSGAEELQLNEKGYFEATGINYLVFDYYYSGPFGDEKNSGIQIIHHGIRTATNGDVRLEPTPEQWDAIPEFDEKKVDREEGFIEASLGYPSYRFGYRIRTESSGEKLLVSVILEEPLPEALEGKAGFNLEFLPSAYFSKTYTMDGKNGVFPLYPGGPMEKPAGVGEFRPLPLATGKELVLTPGDPEKEIAVKSLTGDLSLYDGRNMAQNGWFVLRSLIPAGETGNVVQWEIDAHTIPGWERPPVISHSQAGYHPGQQKRAVIELDNSSKTDMKARLYKISPEDGYRVVLEATPALWGDYLRYTYVIFDFSRITGDGIYCLEYGETRTRPFLIGKDVYRNAWQPTLDIFFPVQMDHMFVNEAYRVWHGAAHLDDARQAPVDHTHFDMYAQGPTTDTPFEPGEHIPGLNRGGWFDAGDYDIRTPSQISTVLGLVQIWEEFGLKRDQTTVDRDRRYVDIHVPDGEPDILQQIEHGAIQLLAQHEAVGHAIPGIIAPTLAQYTHLGDGVTKTDNLIYDPGLEEGEQRGGYSGRPDDRWAFTSRSTGLNYGSAAALAAAARALMEIRPQLAAKCLASAEKVWTEEQGREPDLFRSGNTTGGMPQVEELRAALELLITTEKEVYREKLLERFPMVERFFRFNATLAVRAMPYLEEEQKDRLRETASSYKVQIDSMIYENPYGVPITRGGWAGSGTVIGQSVTHYHLLQAFPDIFDPEDVYRGLHYIYGCHPGSDISLVSGVGTRSKRVAYGMNRADYSFIAGGIVPGVLIHPPDFPENKEDWPFLWGENEYVITMGAPYIFAVNAARALLGRSYLSE